MALNTVLLLAAGMGVNLGLQDPSFDMQFAVPVLDQSPVVTSPAQVNGQVATDVTVKAAAPVVWEYAQVSTTSQGKKVSANFKNAKVSEVLGWLQEQGVSFVVANGMIPSDATVTLNVVDQPAEDVIEAVAAALGGHWQRERGIRVFKKGARAFTFAPGVADVPGLKADEFAKAYTFSDKDFAKNFGPDFAKKMEGMAKDMHVKAFDQKEFAKHFGPDFQKKMEAMTKDMKVKAMDEKELAKHFGPEFQKKMELMHKDMAIKFGPEFEKDMQKRFGPEFEKKMLEHSKQMEKMGKEMEIRMKDFEKQHKELFEKAKKDPGVYQYKDGKLFKVEGKKIDGKDGVFYYTTDKDAKDVVITRDNARAIRDRVVTQGKDVRVLRGGDARTYTLRRGVDMKRDAIDGKKFINSLTPDQKHSQRMKGYILYIDLTKDQREMLGNVPKGKFEIKLKVNDQEVAVRGS